MRTGTAFILTLSFILPFAPPRATGEPIDLSRATVVVRPGDLPNSERAAATVLVEEVQSRAGISLRTATDWPSDGAKIILTSTYEVTDWNRPIPRRDGSDLPELKPEGFRLFCDTDNTVWIVGADPRGVLFGVGAFLRRIDWAERKLSLDDSVDISSSPAYPIRGHQLGYRARANSWDAWTPAQFDQYIRELTFFGVNSIENIPFQDMDTAPHMKLSRRDMNREMSVICERYGLDYWVWTPAEFDLADNAAREAALDQHEELYRDCPELTGVFFPGGDPGENPPELVLPFLEDVAKRLLPIHPDARVWLSLQWFNDGQVEFIFDFLKRDEPEWFGGLVGGPSSPPIPWTRAQLPEKYPYRLYPDITHNKLCQYEVPWWDQAYALTLGREAINPRPLQYAAIHNWYAPYSDGFITYTDGVHDDVNKTVWSALGWDPAMDVHDILTDYARVYFSPAVAAESADGILALETNWRGALRDNASVEGTLQFWQQLEKRAPELANNWRWQLCLIRAYYDAYTRTRLLYETSFEAEANAILAQCGERGAETVMREALGILNLPFANQADLRQDIFELCDRAYRSCGLQTSVPRYEASGAERGAFLDFIDRPLNNKWWLEDEFARVSALSTESEKCERLLQVAAWESPGPGSFYDDVGNIAESPRVVRRQPFDATPANGSQSGPTHWWLDDGMSRLRLSWQVTMDWPEAVVYEGLDPDAEYFVQVTGYGQCLLRVDDEPAPANSAERMEFGDVRKFAVPKFSYADRKLVLTFDQPAGEGHLNWRQQSRLAEVWLLKQ